MIDLIKKTHAEGVVFLSGDIHSSEFCLDESVGCYPLFDHTSSSLNVPLGAGATHRRLGPAYGGANFGDCLHQLEALKDPTISFTTKDAKNTSKLHHTIPHSSLTFSKKNLKAEKTKLTDLIGTWQTFYGPIKFTKNQDNRWRLISTDRSADLHMQGTQLIGTWKSKKSNGSCTFKLTRDGQFLKGAYSIGALPQQLDWAGWSFAPMKK